jgi:hypothetical protein
MITLGALALLSACATATPTVTAAPELPASLSVSEINVNVPYSLRISEGNGYYPATDIVWRGDPIGDRRAQIAALFETGFARGTRDMKGDTPLALDVEIKRFHSITDRTRLTVGGVHHMVFDLTIRDARSGQVVAPKREIEVSLKAFGGLQAVQADQRGQTQKVRVTGHLARVIQQALGQPITQ